MLGDHVHQPLAGVLRVGVELKGPMHELHLVALGELVQRPMQPTLSDQTPRAHHIRPHLHQHRVSFVNASAACTGCGGGVRRPAARYRRACSPVGLEDFGEESREQPIAQTYRQGFQ